LGGPAPFPTLAAAAQVTSRIRLGTYVLNAAFYRPALLARDAAAVDLLSDGRLDLGLGTGYVREEFEAAEMPFPSAGTRIAHLEHVTKYLKANHPSIPIVIAGNGDRVLSVAARYADIIGLTGSDLGRIADDPLAERVAFVREAAGERFGSIELNLAIIACPSDDSGRPDLSIVRRYSPHLSDDRLLELPGTLAGSAREVADKIRVLHATYGVSSLTVQQRHAAFISSVIAELR
jgi:probable F420-dependent oxidoreductase